MYALVITKRKETDVQIELYQSRQDLENRMIMRYNNYLKKAKEIDWRYTSFDNENWYGSIDDWDDRIEYRCCEVTQTDNSTLNVY